MSANPTSEAVAPIGAIFEYPLTIRESHLDTFGHVNNAAYLQIFEEARWEMMTVRGYPLASVQQTRQGPTILQVQLRFQHEVRNREAVVIRSFITSISRKTGTLRQVLVNSRGEEACIADFVAGLFDMNTRRLIEPTDAWKRVLGLIGP